MKQLYKLCKYIFLGGGGSKVVGLNLFDKRMFAMDTSTYDKFI